MLGCASGGGSASPRPDIGSAATALEVNNLNWQTMHVYVLAAGQRWSLGLVTSHSKQVFRLPDGIFATDRDVIFQADPVGSVVVFNSDPIILEPGDTVEWTLHNRLLQSSIFVR